MTLVTEFPGPGPDIFRNTQALNAAYLNLDKDIKGPQKGRLAAAPFLLFSLRENDLDWWQNGLSGDPQQPLLGSPKPCSNDALAIQTAAIGFLWQLARDNPYVARLISGASIAWCELLADFPLVTVLDRVGRRGDLIQSRLDESSYNFQRLISTGVSSQAFLRNAVQIAALQDLLNQTSHSRTVRLAAAACKMSSGALSVATETT